MVDWKTIVKSIAPALGTALGGPLTGAAIKAIAEKALGKPDASEAEVEAMVLGASPEVLQALKAAEYEFRYNMAKLNIDVFGLEVQDKASARELFKVNMWPQVILSAVYVIGYFVVLSYVLWAWFSGVTLPPESAGLKDVALLLLGGMTTQIPQIINFWFGTSQGSKEKTNQMAQMAGAGK